jgi:hypothetical protein
MPNSTVVDPSSHPCKRENWSPTDVCEGSNCIECIEDLGCKAHREGNFMKGRDCATESRGLKRTQTSKSMPKLPNYLMPGMNAEDDNVISRRASRLLVLRHSDAQVIPPPGKFSQASKTSVRTLPRSRSENELLDARMNTSRCTAHHKSTHGGLFDQTDSNSKIQGLSSDGFHSRPTSVFSVWKSLMTSSTTDDLGDLAH